MKIFKTKTRVRYAETDAAGIVYYNNFFVYFELGRIELFRTLGLTYDWRLPIADTYCKFHSSAFFDEMLEIHSFVEKTRRCGFKIGCRVYRITDSEPILLAEGYTSMVTVGDDKKPIPLPADFQKAFEGAI